MACIREGVMSGQPLKNNLKTAQQLRERMDKWDYEIKKLLHNRRSSSLN
jgi:hypothetical protein